MKTYAEWLEEFRTKIRAEYERCRMDKQLAKYIYEVEKPATVLPKGSGPIGAQIIREGAPSPEPYVISSQVVTPKDVGFTVNLKDWSEKKEYTYIDTLLASLGRDIATREGFVILRAMFEKAGHSREVKTKGQLTKEDIKEAKDWIRKQGWYADTSVIHPEQEAQFLIRREILEPTLLTGYAPFGFASEEERGPNYAGWLNGLNVYWTPLVKGLAFVYRKSEIIVMKTPLNIDFDNLDKPSKLIIKRYCSSAPVDERGVVKITL